MAEMLTLKEYLDAGGVFEEIPDKYLVGLAPEWPGPTAELPCTDGYCDCNVEKFRIDGSMFYSATAFEGCVKVGGWYFGTSAGRTCGYVGTTRGLSTTGWEVVLAKKDLIEGDS